MSIWKNGKLIAGGRQCMPLLSFMWADHILNDPSWLRADTFSWQSGVVYQAAYQHLVNELPVYVSALTFGNNVSGERYSTGDDLSATYPYCWLKTGTSDLYYTADENPEVGDYVYVSSSGGTKSLIKSITTSLPTPETETIAGTTISYYTASDGHKIVLPNQESNVTAIYNATGVAWYYILDTVNQRFKLPRTKFGFVGLHDTVGNYVPESLPNIIGTFESHNGSLSGGTGVFTGSSPVSSQGLSGVGSFPHVMTFDASTYSSAYQNSAPVQQRATQMYLYFYVGSFTQTALENTAGLNSELFNGKVDVGHEVIAFQAPTAGNNYTWYRLYADGWVEQGGVTSGAPANVVLPVEMADTNYSIMGCSRYALSGSGWFSAGTITTTGFGCNLQYGNGTQSAGTSIQWEVRGMAA